MNCPSTKFEDFVLWCCAEGTYASRGGRLLSFSKEPRPECEQSLPAETEKSEVNTVAVWVGVIVMVLITVFLGCCCRAWQKQKREEEKEQKRMKREKMKKEKRERQKAKKKTKKEQKTKKAQVPKTIKRTFLETTV